jgi:hypothetical protein
VVEKDDVTLLFRVSGVRGETVHHVWWKRMMSPYCSGYFRCEGRNGPPCVVEKDDIILLFRVSGVRGKMVHLAW